MTARELDAQRIQKEWNESGRWKGIKRGYGPEDVVRLRGSMQIEHTLAKRGAEKLWRLLNSEDVRQYPRRVDRQSGHAAGEGGAESDLSVGLASGGRCKFGRRDVPGPIALSRSIQCRQWSGALTTRLCRADQIQWMEGKNPSESRLCRLLRTDRRGCRGGLWRSAQCVRADEVHDRSGSCRVCTSRINWLPSRSAVTWAARYWCPRVRRWQSSWQRAWPPTSVACQRYC